MVNLINHYKRYGLQMGLMLAGVDENGPNLYYINTEGSRIKGHLFSVGSGMTYAYGVLDTFYRYDMSLEEAVELGKIFVIIKEEEPFITLPTGTQLQEVTQEFTTCTREDGLKRLLGMMSTCFTTSTGERRVSSTIPKEESSDVQNDLCDMHILITLSN
jgi:hypothetical protein